MQIGLVLSGGGARCFAQVGALKALEEQGAEVSAIAGNSAGAIIGALYAAGHRADEVARILCNADYGALLRVKGGAGLSGHENMAAFLAEHLPETFDALKIPLAVPATDIQSAEQVVFSAGPLVPAVCASNAFPGLFLPIEHAGRVLVDGGLLNNFPLDLIRPLTSARIVALDTRPSPTARLDLPAEDAGLWGRLKGSFDGRIPMIARVLEKAYTITQSRLVELLATMHPPDLWIRPALSDDFDIQDFGRFDEAYELGYNAVCGVADELERLTRAVTATAP
jgi:NTE family protein